MPTKLLRCLLGLLAAVSILSSLAWAAQTLGPVTDEIGVIRIPKGAPIQIGGSWVLSGPDTPCGLGKKRAVETTIKQLGGQRLDHPVKGNAPASPSNASTGRTGRSKRAWYPLH